MSRCMCRLIGSCLCTRSCVLFYRRWGSESISGKDGSERPVVIFLTLISSSSLWVLIFFLQHRCVMPYLCHLLIYSLTSFSLVLQLSARDCSLFRFIVLLIGRILLQFLIIFFSRNFLQIMKLGSCSSWRLPSFLLLESRKRKKIQFMVTSYYKLLSKLHQTLSISRAEKYAASCSSLRCRSAFIFSSCFNLAPPKADPCSSTVLWRMSTSSDGEIGPSI